MKTTVLLPDEAGLRHSARQGTAGRRALLALAGIGLPLVARAQGTFPTRPIRFVVPYAPGGTGDIMSRIIANGLPAYLGQPVVVENRSGANGIIGADVIAKAAPDGHTIGLVVSSHMINKAIRPDMPFDPIAAFEPITLAARTHFCLAVSGTIPANSVQEFIAYVKARPGQLSYVSAGPGSNIHVFLEWFSRRAGLDVLHVPYRSGSTAHADLIAGRVHFTIDSYAAFKPHFDAGTMRLLAFGGPGRPAARPDVPTIEEAAGIPGYEAGSWGGVLAPAGTSAPILDALNAAILGVLRSDETRQRMTEIGGDVTATTRTEFARIMDADAARFNALVREFNITAQG
jgi:tripartite-type tricarboxylate transporter receptor subunit TctC